ncbi:MAG: enoyl-CoA hydratase/isomerase family protein [Pseudolabrys sp.]|nr:enoyl-CoA hydratase/isomerase family protein [Pseudolabrys sp.]MDP2298919.1 enoyl-CoA hydratase/isomerase family protein [Pseudolabrys sp.]
MADNRLVRTYLRDGVGHIVLNRPESRNALNSDLMHALCNVFSEADADPKIRVMVLRGEGKGFCAGADLKATAALADEPAVRAHAKLMRRLLETPAALNKPLIAQVHGFALGAGFALALACDAVICGEDTKLGYPEARHGIVPALVLPGFLRLAGAQVTFDMMAMGRLIDGRMAEKLGLVRSVVELELDSAAAAYAADLASRPEHFMRSLKRLIQTAAASPETAMAAAEQINVEGRLARLQE